MKRQILVLIVPVLLLLSVCSAALIYMNKVKVEKNRLAEAHFMTSELYRLLTWNVEQHYTIESAVLNDFSVTDKEDKIHRFSELLSNSNGRHKLVFYFSSLNCNSCVDAELNNLKSFGHLIGEDNVIIIAQYESSRQLRAFLASREFDIPVYCVKTNPVSILETMNFPFSFIVNQEMRMDLFFIPMKEILSYSEMYYSTIYERFFKEESNERQ